MMKIRRKNALPFLAFFLITVGNGRYVSSCYGFFVEYLGLAILAFCSIYSLDVQHLNIRKAIRCLLVSVSLCIGSFFQSTSPGTRLTLMMTALLIVILSISSENVINSNSKLKTVSNAILCGCVVNSAIGIVTKTLGLQFGFNVSWIGVIFSSGFSVKNYCGGAWLAAFLGYYLYFKQTENIHLRKNRGVLLIIMFMIVLSGSKGALLLALAFIFCVNQKKFFNFRKNQIYIFGLIIIAFSVLLYRRVLPSITTYAYRIRGVTALLNTFKANPKYFVFGLSEVAFANTGHDYATNMRNFFGWQASVEMAYVNIFIKNGFLGFAAYLYIYFRFVKMAQHSKNKNLIYSILAVMILSGFVETYISTVHYLLGPFLYCLINGLLKCDSQRY